MIKKKLQQINIYVRRDQPDIIHKIASFNSRCAKTVFFLTHHK